MSKINKFSKFEMKGLEKVSGGLGGRQGTIGVSNCGTENEDTFQDYQTDCGDIVKELPSA